MSYFLSGDVFILRLTFRNTLIVADNTLLETSSTSLSAVNRVSLLSSQAHSRGRLTFKVTRGERSKSHAWNWPAQGRRCKMRFAIPRFRFIHDGRTTRRSVNRPSDNCEARNYENIRIGERKRIFGTQENFPKIDSVFNDRWIRGKTRGVRLTHVVHFQRVDINNSALIWKMYNCPIMILIRVESNARCAFYPSKTWDRHMLRWIYKGISVSMDVKLISEKDPLVIRPISISDINSTIFHLDLRRGNTHVSVYFPITRMNVHAAHYEWKVAAIRFARKTGSYDRNRGSPLHLADFTDFQVIAERRVRRQLGTDPSSFEFRIFFFNLLIEQYMSSVKNDDEYDFTSLYELPLHYHVFLTFKMHLNT